MTKVLKANMISAASSQEALLYSVQRKTWAPHTNKDAMLSAFVEWVWQPVPEGGHSINYRTTLHLSAFCWHSHQIQRCFVCTGRRSREIEVDPVTNKHPMVLVSAECSQLYPASLDQSEVEKWYCLLQAHGA